MSASIAQATIDVVATAQVHGGTRVITLSVMAADPATLTVTTPRSHRERHVVTLHAYDSNHPGDQRVMLIAGAPRRGEIVKQALETAANLLRPSAGDEPCNCWAGWDPYCGAPGCWGVVKKPLPAAAATV
jgi:hypothetical protein